jgi:hypothetical protein
VGNQKVKEMQNPADMIQEHPIWAFFVSMIVAVLILGGLLVVLLSGDVLLAKYLDPLEKLSIGMQGVIGTAVVCASAFVAVIIAWAALNTSKATKELAERARNPFYITERQWLIARRRLVSQLDFMLVNSDQLLGAIRPDIPGAPTEQDSAKSLFNVIGALRRTHAALASYASNHALMVSKGIAMGIAAKRMRQHHPKERSEDNSRDQSEKLHAFLNSWNEPLPVYPTAHLHFMTHWMSKSKVTLTVRAAMHAIFEIIIRIDYLDNRTQAAVLTTQQYTPQERLDILKGDVCDILVHVAVLRAYMEAELTFALCDVDKTDDAAIEKAIVQLIQDADRNTFFACKPSAKSSGEYTDDTEAGYQFAMVSIMLERAHVFDKEEKTDSGEIKKSSRLDDLYGWQFSKKRDQPTDNVPESD